MLVIHFHLMPCRFPRKLPVVDSPVRLVARGRQLVVNRQAHVVSLAFMVQRPGQSVTHEMALAAQHDLAAAARAFWPHQTVLKPVPSSIIDIRPRGFYENSNVKSP